MENKSITKKERFRNWLCAIAVFCALLILLGIFAAVDSSALEVPRYTSTTNELGGKGALNTMDANTLVNYVIALDQLGYLDTQHFLILARPSGGTTTRLYVSATAGGQPVIGQDSTLTISSFNTVEFYGSARYYGAMQVSSMSFPIENVLCYKVGNNIVNNVSNGTYTTGTGQLDKAFSDYLIEFTNYANTILPWDGDDFQSGYDDGYTDGYDDGASEDELALAYQEGYEIGYLDGTDYGYEQGYNRALIDATPNELDIERIITAIPASVRTIFDETLGFELFGINVAGTLLTILVVAIVAFVVRKLLDSR